MCNYRLWAGTCNSHKVASGEVISQQLFESCSLCLAEDLESKDQTSQMHLATESSFLFLSLQHLVPSHTLGSPTPLPSSVAEVSLIKWDRHQ